MRAALCIYASLFTALALTHCKPEAQHRQGYSDRHVVVLSHESSVSVPQFLRSLFK